MISDEQRRAFQLWMEILQKPCSKLYTIALWVQKVVPAGVSTYGREMLYLRHN